MAADASCEPAEHQAFQQHDTYWFSIFNRMGLGLCRPTAHSGEVHGRREPAEASRSKTHRHGVDDISAIRLDCYGLGRHRSFRRQPAGKSRDSFYNTQPAAI